LSRCVATERSCEMADSLRPVVLSVRVYEVLLRAYPVAFRKEYAGEMTRVFRELAADAWRERGAAGLRATWFRVLGDLAWTAPREHLNDLPRRVEMKSAAFAVFSALLAVVVHFYVFAVVWMAFWATRCLLAGSLLVPPANPVVELTMFYLPALLTGMILARVKPFAAREVTVPFGITAYFALLAVLDGGPPWWVALLFAASGGFLSLLGCLVMKSVSRRLAKPCAA
jgi:hypothetical protein